MARAYLLPLLLVSLVAAGSQATKPGGCPFRKPGQ